VNISQSVILKTKNANQLNAHFSYATQISYTDVEDFARFDFIEFSPFSGKIN
jgi:hypothetical protein